VYYTP